MSIAETPTVTTGLQQIPDEKYHALPFASKHALDVIRESSPGHLWYRRQHPQEPTDAMRFGSALHTFVLERHEFDSRHPISSQCSAILKSGKNAGQPCRNDATHQLAGGGYCGTHKPEGAQFIPNTLSRDEADRIRAMADAINAHPAAHAVLELADPDDKNEVAVITDRLLDTGFTVRCKAKLDGLRIKNWQAVIDIKTCQCAAFDSFQKDVDNFGYGRQAAYYFDILDEIGIHAEHFIIIAVEKSAPFAVATYTLSRDSMAVQTGRDENERLLHRYALCESSGFWPFYDDEFKPIDLAPWAVRRALQRD